VRVAFADGPFRAATKVYVDPFADIAIIEVDAKDRQRPVATLACSDRLEVGEPIGAFGHPLGMPFTGSRGIVSGKTDKFGPDLIQIDATVDHGNSGGPVISLRSGEVVGVATAGAGGSKADRLNFATPIRDVCRIVELLGAGGSPSPPHMAITLLKDEDGRHTLQVGSTNDAKRWPLEQGDRIVSLKGADSLATLGQLVTALRGHGGRVPLAIERKGRRLVVEVTPQPRPALLSRRGLSIDGALIAPVEFEDAVTLREAAPLIVHSVEPGSAAEMCGLEQQDIVRSIDGTKFDDLDRLARHLKDRPSDQPIAVVVRRWSSQLNRIFEYHVRELPGEDIHPVGRDAQLSAR
jgi:S1-C subfamily serine protease